MENQNQHKRSLSIISCVYTKLGGTSPSSQIRIISIQLKEIREELLEIAKKISNCILVHAPFPIAFQLTNTVKQMVLKVDHVSFFFFFELLLTTHRVSQRFQ